MKTAANRKGRQVPRIDPSALQAEVVAATPQLRQEILEQVQVVAARTGVWPIDEHASAWLTSNHLEAAADAAQPATLVPTREPEVLLVRCGPTTALYALRFGQTAEVVAPDSATAAATLPSLLGALPPGTLVWARGLHSPVAAAALGLGMAPVRRILVLVRENTRHASAPRLPANFRLRSFRVGSDETAWLALNEAAFAALPDQGGWRMDDLLARLGAPWFDPTAFLILEGPSGAMVGCVWVKLEAGSQPLRPQDGAHPGGEIYVLSVHPEYHGLGLGRALLMAGLARIHAAGNSRAHLYVDTTNTSAGRLYTAAGFTARERILAFATPGDPGGAGASPRTGTTSHGLALD